MRNESGERAERDGGPTPGRASVVVARPGAFLTLVILSCLGAGLAIYWLLRTMHI